LMSAAIAVMSAAVASRTDVIKSFSFPESVGRQLSASQLKILFGAAQADGRNTSQFSSPLVRSSRTRVRLQLRRATVSARP
jgi:hypothetical protein